MEGPGETPLDPGEIGDPFVESQNLLLVRVAAAGVEGAVEVFESPSSRGAFIS